MGTYWLWACDERREFAQPGNIKDPDELTRRCRWLFRERWFNKPVRLLHDSSEETQDAYYDIVDTYTDVSAEADRLVRMFEGK